MKRYVKRFLQEKGIIVAGNLDALDKVDNLTARKIKKDLVGLDFINAPHGRITNYLDHVLAYANAL